MSEIFQVTVFINGTEHYTDVFKYPLENGFLYVLGEGGQELLSVENVHGKWSLKQGPFISEADFNGIAQQLSNC